MRYQLVALFDDDSNTKLRAYQRSVCKKYRLYKNNSELFIPLSFIDDNNGNLMEHLIEKTLDPYKFFKVKLNNSISISEKNKMVNLEVDSKGYISKISRNLNDSFGDYKISSVSTFDEDSPLHLSIAPSNYTIKKACNNATIPLLKDNDYLTYLKIVKIELWKVSSNKKDRTVVKTFNLKPF